MIGTPVSVDCGTFGTGLVFDGKFYVKTNLHRILAKPPFSISFFVRFEEAQVENACVFGMFDAENGIYMRLW